MDFEDGKLLENKDILEKELRELLLKLNPGLIVTYDHSGVTGHPDHITASLVVSEVLKNSPLNSKLLWVALKGLPKLFNRRSKTFKYFTVPDLKVTLSFKSKIKKVEASLRHRSQIDSFKTKVLLILFSILSSETYHLVNLNKDYQYKYVEFDI